MRLTKTTSHAIRIAIDCASAEGRLVKVADIAQRLDISQLNVFKIVHILSRQGFVEAQRGRSGGVRLARPAAEIRIGDIVRAIEATEIEVAGEDEARPISKRGAKPQINAIFDDALDAFISVLDQHTLADMTRAGAKSVRLAPPPAPKTATKPKSRAAKAAGRAAQTLRG